MTKEDIPIRKTLFQESEINWGELSILGLSKTLLEESNDLTRLLNGYKTSLINSGGILIGQIPIDEFSAKYHLVRNEITGKVETRVTLPQASLIIPKEIFGYVFNDRDRQELETRGMLSHSVNLRPLVDGDKTRMVAVKSKTLGSMKHFVGVDPETNRIEFLPAYQIRIPSKIKGKELSNIEKLELLEGKEIVLSGLQSENGEAFTAIVQVHAGKGSLQIKEVKNELETSLEINKSI